MAKKDDSLVGFDPLAWMKEETEQDDDAKDHGKNNAETKIKTKLDNSQDNSTAVDSGEEKTANGIESVADSIVELETQRIEDSTNESKITLDETLNIQNVASLHEQFVKLIENQDKIEIDASSVAVIDTATLQLLVILKKTAVELHKEVIIDFPSDNFIESAELLGVSEILEVDQAAAGFF